MSWISLVLGATTATAALPDLTIHAATAKPRVEYFNFAPNSCEVLEGCVVAGTRRLLRFETEIRNLGPGDLEMGDPANNPLFVYASCHGHYHFEGFAGYQLLDDNGSPVLNGLKVGFCIEDTYDWRTGGTEGRYYHCSNQGLRAGFADIYTYDVPCQWIDVTGLPPGQYTLEIVADPQNFFPEADESNNAVYVPVVIPTECDVTPVNDDIANALPITGEPISIAGNNACASKTPDEPDHANNRGGRSVWFRWTAPADGRTIISTKGSGLDTVLAVYTLSAPSAWRVVAANDDINPGRVRQSRVAFQARGGVDYYIAVDGYDGAYGNFFLHINPPENDDFGHCLALTGASGSVAGHTIGATRQPGEPAHATTFGAHSIWYCWEAPRAGQVEFATRGSDFDTSLAIYSGSTMASLVAVGGDNDAGGNATSLATFTAAAHTTYRIAVDGHGNASGHVALSWRYLANNPGPNPANPMPDLKVDRASVLASLNVGYSTFKRSDCAVINGCVPHAGRRLLLSFEVPIVNLGNLDLALPAPENAPDQYEVSGCHGHAHFRNIIAVTLLDTGKNPVLPTRFISRCVNDSKPATLDAPTQPAYTCDVPGLQKGWSSVDPDGAECQWLDLTGVRNGNYLLKVVVNPERTLPESDVRNNAVLIPVTVTRPR